ncbi:FAD-binding monooxygenase [Bisporella sp. PMI_857]|nr:FAD-binding monooxygenase [Bisporella sp. PMI_857]
MTDKTSSTVCVVGAGPVGLFTTLLLAQAGIDVVVFEAEDAIVKSPRAMGYFDITQDEFRKAGILDEIKEAGLLNDQGLKWRRPQDGGELAGLPSGPDPSHWPIQLGQHAVGEIILKRLAQFPKVHVHFGHKLESLEQSDADGTVLTRYTGDREHTSQYLVGADGGKSTARKLTGIQLEGFTWEDFQMVALNIEYDLAALGWAPGNAVVGDDIWAVVARIGKDNLWRVAYGIPTSELDPEEPYDEARERTRARGKLAKLLPGPTDEARIDRISLYRLRQLCADTYLKGRVVLAGDAAHVTSPVGGLGLTTGLLDAALLGRTLKKIIVETEPLELLKSYAETRRDVFQNVTNPAAIFHTRLLTGKDAESVATREEFLEKVNQRDFGYLKKLGESFSKLTSTRNE